MGPSQAYWVPMGHMYTDAYREMSGDAASELC